MRPVDRALTTADRHFDDSRSAAVWEAQRAPNVPMRLVQPVGGSPAAALHPELRG